MNELPREILHRIFEFTDFRVLIDLYPIFHDQHGLLECIKSVIFETVEISDDETEIEFINIGSDDLRIRLSNVVISTKELDKLKRLEKYIKEAGINKCDRTSLSQVSKVLTDLRYLKKLSTDKRLCLARSLVEIEIPWEEDLPICGDNDSLEKLVLTRGVSTLSTRFKPHDYHFPQLKSFEGRLSFGNLVGKQWVGYPNLESLKITFSIRPTFTLNDVNSKYFPKLQRLTILDAQASWFREFPGDQGTVMIGNIDIQSLVYLESSGTPDAEGWKWDSLRNLRELVWTIGKLTDFEKICRSLPKLERVSFRNTKEGMASMKCLQHLKKLEYLELIDQGIENIEGVDGLSNLKELCLESNRIEKIENLQKSSKLKKLILNNNRISRIGNLGYLENLQVLDVSKNYISEAGELRKFSNLVRLSI
ncbi:hypothetical protein DASC09_030750 [Saccharomycopsis crataegensis]|uniref:F-box domain-containing protein n=1 Tax=Saccharomycopsis crataegensis TaxID=43959 RepID=A0AAV5QN44_9ASCO|nr:hypothetical protein DASC09_030750 [Saccharomycopsis crataegensis]